MKIKTYLTFLLSVAFAFSLTACKGSDDSSSNSTPTSIDSTADSVSDSTQTPTANDCTFTVVTDNGTTVANASFTLISESNTYPLTTDASGSIKAQIPAGTYMLDYDFETLPENHIPDVWEVNVTLGATITLLLNDNTPNGTLEKPFWLVDDVTSLSLNAGAEVYYQCRNNNVTFTIESENVSVTCGDVTYTAENGVVTFTITHDIGAASIFSVKNNGTETIETELKTVYPLGTMQNPILLTDASGEVVAEVPQDISLYYKWTATQDGTLTVVSYNPNNYITLQNGNTMSDATWGEESTFIECKTGDEIIIIVGTIDGEAMIIDFEYSI